MVGLGWAALEALVRVADVGVLADDAIVSGSTCAGLAHGIALLAGTALGITVVTVSTSRNTLLVSIQEGLSGAGCAGCGFQAAGSARGIAGQTLSTVEILARVASWGAGGIIQKESIGTAVALSGGGSEAGSTAIGAGLTSILSIAELSYSALSDTGAISLKELVGWASVTLGSIDTVGTTSFTCGTFAIVGVFSYWALVGTG